MCVCVCLYVLTLKWVMCCRSDQDPVWVDWLVKMREALNSPASSSSSTSRFLSFLLFSLFTLPHLLALLPQHDSGLMISIPPTSPILALLLLHMLEAQCKSQN